MVNMDFSISVIIILFNFRGLIGTFGGGFLADKFQSWTDRGYPIFCLIVLLFSIPVQIFAFLAPSFTISIILAFPSFMVRFNIITILVWIWYCPCNVPCSSPCCSFFNEIFGCLLGNVILGRCWVIRTIACRIFESIEYPIL